MESTGNLQDDNFDYLWNDPTSVTERGKALGTPFVQGVKDGSLDPTVFGGYVVQDCIYLYKQWEFIKIAAGKATDLDLLKFLNLTADKYKKYYEAAFQTWHIDHPSGIKLGSECQAYVDFAKNVAQSMDTIYFLVAMSPCLKLWSWLGTQIGTQHGAYDNWVKNNFVGGSTLAKIIDFINKDKTIDRKKALCVFTTGIGHEYKFFNSAGK